MTLDLPSTWLEQAFIWIWTTSLSATVLVVIVVVLQLLLRRLLTARWSHALWICVLLRLIIPFVPAADFSIFNLSTGVFANIPPGPPVGLAGGVTSLPAQESRDSVLTFQSDSHTTPPAFANPRVLGKPRGPEPRDILRLVPAIWVTGVISYFFVVVAFHYKLAARLRREQPIVSSRIDSIVREQKRLLGIKNEIAVHETNRVNTPSLFGFIKPRLLFPRGMIENFTDHELRLIILHELVHVKRRDVLLHWLVILVQSLHWFNPFVWLALHRLRLSLECVCDAAVLSHLNSEQRHAYGNTLIKLVDRFSAAPLTPGLVSIINHENQIHRRITMIAKFKPTKRVITIASGLLLLTLGCLTFTRAREKPALVPPAAVDVTAASPAAEPHQTREEAERRVVRLEAMIQEQDEAIAKKQAEMDKMREKAGISESEASGADSTIEPETLRKLEQLRIEAIAQYSQVRAVYDYLRDLPRASLLKTIPTASPDPLLSTLMEQRAAAEQKLAQLMVSYSEQHPDMQATRTLLKQIGQQIEDRLDGTLAGLKGKTESYKARVDELEKEVETGKKRAVEASLSRTISRRPYLKAKRELEAMEAFRDRLWLRLQEQKVDAVLSN